MFTLRSFFSKSPAAAPTATPAQAQTLHGIASKFVTATQAALTRLRDDQSEKPTLTVADYSHEHRLVRMCVQPDFELTFESTFQLVLSANAITSSARNYLPQTLKNAPDTKPITEEQRTQISHDLRTFMDDYATGNVDQAALKAAEKLKEFADQGNPGRLTIGTLEELLCYMQIICYALKADTALDLQALTQQFNMALHHPEQVTPPTSGMTTPTESASSTSSVADENTFSIAAMTYNVANNNLHKEAITSLRKTLFPEQTTGADPDLIIFALQEAKNSIQGAETIPTRILKDREGYRSLPYEILHNENARVLTHPENLLNHALPSKTELAIAYNTTRFPENRPHIKHQGICTSDDRERKGGLYAILSINEVNIAVVCVHLDSKNEKTAKQQLTNLITQCEKDCKEREIVLDEMLIAGDFNIRLDLTEKTNSLRSPMQRRDTLCPAEGRSDSIKTTNQTWKDDPNFPLLNRITLHAPHDFTYGQDSPILVPNSRREGRYDIGALDLIANISYDTGRRPLLVVKENLSVAKVTTPKWIGMGTGMKPASDHQPVIAEATLTTNLSAEEKLIRKYYELLQSIKNNSYVKESDIPTNCPARRTDPRRTLADEIDLIKQHITFLINHPNVFPKMTETEFCKLIFNTCEEIEALSGNSGEWMLEKYTQLLTVNNTFLNLSRVNLLKPFRLWLANKNIEPSTVRAYSYQKKNGTITITRSGFFETKEDMGASRNIKAIKARKPAATP